MQQVSIGQFLTQLATDAAAFAAFLDNPAEFARPRLSPRASQALLSGEDNEIYNALIEEWNTFANPTLDTGSNQYAQTDVDLPIVSATIVNCVIEMIDAGEIDCEI